MMNMRIYKYFAALLLSVSIAASCSKGTTVEELQPQDPVKPAATLPYISIGKTATKVMMDNADLHTNGNKIQVYDILSGFEGKINGQTWTDGSVYINETLEYNSAISQTIWQYPTGHLYPWTETGTHKFFGWLTCDATDPENPLNLSSLVSTSLSGTTLDVSAINFNTTTPQFDFMYSDMVTRNAAEKNYNTVPLNFKHLFTALSFRVSCLSNVNVKITSLQLNNIKNNKKATIKFAESQVELEDVTGGNSFMPTFSEFELEMNHFYDVLAKTEVSSSTPKNFYMLWPQTASEVAAMEVVVEYSLKIDNNWVEQEPFSKNLASMAWEAGMRNNYTLVFTDKRIDLTSEVLPWDYNEYDVDFGSGAILADPQLKFETSPATHVVLEGKTYTILDGNPLKGTFKVVTPIGGTWVIDMTGDIQYFSISPTSGPINNTLTTITVTPNTGPGFERTEDKKIHFTFMVRTSGRDINADSELNMDDVEVVLPRNQ